MTITTRVVGKLGGFEQVSADPYARTYRLELPPGSWQVMAICLNTAVVKQIATRIGDQTMPNITVSSGSISAFSMWPASARVLGGRAIDIDAGVNCQISNITAVRYE